LKLDCGHPCIGFCGEQCPPVCRVSDCPSYDADTFEIFLGFEDDEDSKFVYLPDCKHTIED